MKKGVLAVTVVICCLVSFLALRRQNLPPNFHRELHEIVTSGLKHEDHVEPKIIPLNESGSNTVSSSGESEPSLYSKFLAEETTWLKGMEKNNIKKTDALKFGDLEVTILYISKPSSDQINEAKRILANYVTSAKDEDERISIYTKFSELQKIYLRYDAQFKFTAYLLSKSPAKRDSIVTGFSDDFNATSNVEGSLVFKKGITKQFSDEQIPSRFAHLFEIKVD